MNICGNSELEVKKNQKEEEASHLSKEHNTLVCPEAQRNWVYVIILYDHHEKLVVVSFF